MQANQPLVSINLPTYNHEAYIADCLASLMAQRYENIEVLVMDDCSTDTTLEIAKAFAKKHPEKIKVHPNEQNQGLPRNFTRGLKRAKGKYYVNFNSDDIMLPDNITEQVRVLEANPQATFCHANAIYFDTETGEQIKLRHKTPPLETSFRRFMIGSNACAPAAMMRASALPAEFPEQAGVACDWPFFAAVLSKGEGVYIHKPLIKYRIHEKNVSKDITIHYHSLKALDWMKENLETTPEIIYGYSRKRRIVGKHLWWRKRYVKALFYILWGFGGHLAYALRCFPRGFRTIYLVETKKL